MEAITLEKTLKGDRKGKRTASNPSTALPSSPPEYCPHIFMGVLMNNIHKFMNVTCPKCGTEYHDRIEKDFIISNKKCLMCDSMDLESYDDTRDHESWQKFCEAGFRRLYELREE